MGDFKTSIVIAATREPFKNHWESRGEFHIWKQKSNAKRMKFQTIWKNKNWINGILFLLKLKLFFICNRRASEIKVNLN